jgi:curved DNA-binding protein
MARDFYEALGVQRDATPEQIQQAFRKLARQFHPDINSDPAAEDRFKEVNEAYQVLSDPRTRARYDRFGEDFRRVPQDWDPAAERVGAGFGGAGSRRTAGPGGGVRVEGDWDGVDIDDLLGSMFGGGFGGGFGGAGRTGPMPGSDQEAELELTIEEAYRGGKRKITLGGTGQPRTYDVNVPAGVLPGQRIRLAGQGGTGRGGGEAGDLYLVVRITPHPRYRLSGRDIVVDLQVTPWEAALGATVPVTTPGGEVKVKVAAGSSSGRRLRLRGEGMPNPRGTAGDLYAEVKIMVPPRLTKAERKYFQALANESTFDPRKTR